MLCKTSLFIFALAALAAGCNLDDDTKNACNSAADCLDGYQCVNSVCVGGGNTGVDAPSGPYFGTVEAMTSQSAGLAAANYQTLVGATSALGTPGCALVGNLQASPGGAGAVVYAKVQAESGDARCPNGTFAIVNDPNACMQTFPDELRPGCALYKRWDASGQLVANQLATGGYVQVQQVYVSDMEYRCDVQLSIQFAGGVAIGKAFSFTYNPYGPTEKFCTNG